LKIGLGPGASARYGVVLWEARNAGDRKG